jgi:hypothetical protein
MEDLLNKYIRVFTEDRDRYQTNVRFLQVSDATRLYWQGRLDEAARTLAALNDVLHTTRVRKDGVA